MARAANSPAQQRAFQKHLTQTEQHVARLEKVFERLEESPRGKKCEGGINTAAAAVGVEEDEEFDAE